MTVASTTYRRRGLAALPAALLATVLAGAAVALGTAAAPAARAAGGYCTGAGVNVVVDFTGQGGGIAKGCATRGAGGNAWDAFEAAGFPLTPVQRYPGAVCRVSGRPADVSCQGMPPGDAYWGFFASHGTGWSYASVGPSSYRVADGDTVGFAWQGGSKRQPAAAPAAPRPSSTPTPQAHPSATHSAGDHASDAVRPHPKASSTTPSAAAAPTGAASPGVPASTASTASAASAPHHRTQHPHRQAAATRTSATPGAASASAEPSSSAAAAPALDPASAPAAADSGGVPWWVPVIVLVVLAGAGGAVALRRRTTAG